MNTRLTLSIIIPVYNAARFLPETFRSIRRQNQNDFECIFVDDGSTDGSGELCDAFANSFGNARVVHKQNAGEYEARKSGIQVSRGNYLSFLDADDILLDSAVSKMIAATENHSPKAVHLFGFLTIPHEGSFSPGSSSISDKQITMDWKSAVSNLLKYRYPPTMWGKVWPRAWFFHGTDSLDLKIGADFHATAELLIKNKGNSILHDDIIYGYRTNPESAIHKNNFRKAYSTLTNDIIGLFSRLGLELEFSDDLATFRVRNVFAASWKENRLPPRSDIERMVSEFVSCDIDIPIAEKKILKLYAQSLLLGNSVFWMRLMARRIRFQLESVFGKRK